MNTATTILTGHPAADTIFASIAQALRCGLEAKRKRRQSRVASASLGSLSDLALKDIGIHRTEIGSVVRSAANDRRRSHDAA